MAENRTCVGCKWWRCDPEGRCFEGHPVGECRRHPPDSPAGMLGLPRIAQPIVNIWPITTGDAFCGEAAQALN